MSRHDKKQYEKFQIINENEFEYKEKRHLFEEIEHLYYKITTTKQKANFVLNVGEYDDADLTITLKDDTTIVLYFDEQGIFYGFNKNKQGDIDNLTELYYFLSKKTFDMRIAPYIEDLKKNGYFQINECRFYPPDRVVWRDKKFIKKDTRFLKYPNSILLRNKKFSLLERIRQETPFMNVPAFNYITDSDVKFALLDHFMGLRWK